jgi:lipopolysaccharide export system permease protein
MSILNRYILRKFVRPFLASFAALCILLFVSQLFDRLDRFLADGVQFSQVLGFLITSLPFQALQVLPVACLLATLFVVGNLARTREYIAGLAGGLAPEKFLTGLFLAGFLISVSALVANETVIPPVTHYSRTVFRENIRRLGEWREAVFNDLFVAGADGRIWACKVFSSATGQMQRVIVDTYDGARMAEQIDAMDGTWTPDGWVFHNGVRRQFSPDGISITSAQPFQEFKSGYREKPADLAINEPQPEEMTFSALKRHIRRLDSLGVPVRALEVELMMKLAFPFSCFVVTFLGVPLALRGKGSAAIGITAGAALTLTYLGFMQFGKALAQRALPPWAGAWLGNLVFLTVGWVLWMRMRRSA